VAVDHAFRLGYTTYFSYCEQLLPCGLMEQSNSSAIHAIPFESLVMILIAKRCLTYQDKPLFFLPNNCSGDAKGHAALHVIDKRHINFNWAKAQTNSRHGPHAHNGWSIAAAAVHRHFGGGEGNAA
jgi:hypothetical protein